ncbi:winged helix-turn-helix transcriptional regulator [Erythrobacter mangrovi]|uniref:Winged helix-turn-helix transcriptional regulator n=2 Tax=Erythrobacter mangrovi TaxID=2739433 RepID=A0A7D3XJB9_9SPHN|nr:winged helix-turn-helix transcriptional regulator [Erythrobacter mangrovi]
MAISAKLLGDKWTLLVLREVFYGVSCFGDIRADLGVPPATLQKRLAMLVESGILERVPYKVETERTREAYQLTEAGRALLPVVLAMKEWGDNVLRDDEPFTRLVNRQTGERLRIGLVDDNGQAVPLDQAELRALKDDKK